MESWIDIKKGKQISKVPYQAYKDLFEQQGFEIVDQSLSAEPTFSHSTERCEDSEQPQRQNIENLNNQKETEKTSERFRNNQKQNKRRPKQKV